MVRGGKSLIWTRSLADWAADRSLTALVAASDVVLHVPCISIQAITLTETVKPATHVVFTSVNAAVLSMAIPQLATIVRVAKVVYSHGDATVEALRASGIQAVKVPVRTAEELSLWLASHLPPAAHVCIPGAEAPAWPMAESLRKLGFQVASYSVYRTRAIACNQAGQAWTPAATKEATQQWCGVIAFASPSAVAGFAAVFHPKDNQLSSKLVAVAIGPTTRNAAKSHFVRVEMAAANTVSSLAAKALEIHEN